MRTKSLVSKRTALKCIRNSSPIGRQDLLSFPRLKSLRQEHVKLRPSSDSWHPWEQVSHWSQRDTRRLPIPALSTCIVIAKIKKDRNRRYVEAVRVRILPTMTIHNSLPPGDRTMAGVEAKCLLVKGREETKFRFCNDGTSLECWFKTTWMGW